MYTIVSYDIADDARRVKVAKLMEDYGTRVQYSVFDCILDLAARAQLEHGLENIIDPTHDSVRFYPICRRCVRDIRIFGRGHIVESDDVRII